MSKAELIKPFESEGRPDLELSEQQEAALSEEARHLLGVARIEPLMDTFEGTSDITQALVAETGLEGDKIRSLNRKAVQQGLYDRSDIADPKKALQLRLSEEGWAFLEQELDKVR